jgi:hypothetical protein
MKRYLSRARVLLKDFGKHVEDMTARLLKGIVRPGIAPLRRRESVTGTTRRWLPTVQPPTMWTCSVIPQRVEG